MLGLWLAPSRRGGWLWLVGMELCGMVWIGLVNSGYSRKERKISAEHTGGDGEAQPGGGGSGRTHHKGLGAWAALQKGTEG